jgi:NADH-quinone oxidoreductase subunit L
MGGLRKALPVSYWTFLVAALAIAGVFPFAGFFSKDEILWEALKARGPLIWGLGAAGALMTSLYMFRLMFLVFHGKPRHDARVHAPTLSIQVPLVCLAVLSAVGGLVGAPLLLGRHVVKEFLSPVFQTSTAVRLAEPSALAGVHGTASELAMSLVSLSIAVLGIALAYRFYVSSPEVPLRIKDRFGKLYSLLLGKYYVDEIYGALFVRPVTKFASMLWNSVDSLVVDGAVNGSASAVKAGSGLLRRIQTGALQSYALSIALGAVAILAFWLLR